MNITVDRKWKKDTYTIGKVTIDGKYFADSVEDRDRGLSDNMTVAKINSLKVYGKTAIPTGTYDIKMTYSPKFASRVWAKKYDGMVVQIMNVKGFSGVRIHPLNSAEDSLGCIGMGKNTIKGKVTQATLYYYRLVDEFIMPAIKRREKVTITIE